MRPSCGASNIRISNRRFPRPKSTTIPTNPTMNIPKKTKASPGLLLATGAVAACISLSSAPAATVFSFGPSTDYVTSDTNYSRSATRTGSGPWTYLNAFSSSAALSPSSGYAGPTFYGGYTLTSSSVQGSSLTGAVLNNWSLIGGNDALRVYASVSSGWSGSTLGFASAYLFKQSDFAAPYNTGNFALDGLSVTYRASGAGGAFVPTGRWLVEVNNVYYLSEATISSAYNTTSTVSISSATLSATKWTVYDPSASLFLSSTATYSALDLSHVTAVGVYFEKDAYVGTSDTSAALLAISAFSASGAVVPEPSTAGLIVPGMLVVGLMLKGRIGRR